VLLCLPCVYTLSVSENWRFIPRYFASMKFRDEKMQFPGSCNVRASCSDICYAITKSYTAQVRDLKSDKNCMRLIDF
jgi:hypothetical protein